MKKTRISSVQKKLIWVIYSSIYAMDVLIQLFMADGWMDGLWVITFEGEERAYKLDANQSFMSSLDREFSNSVFTIFTTTIGCLLFTW
jgi:hypothetical protein